MVVSKKITEKNRNKTEKGGWEPKKGLGGAKMGN